MGHCLYKYFGHKNHLENFIEHGEVYLNSVSYFLNCEENSRRDETENLNVYRPINGLIVNSSITGQTFTVPLQLNSQIYGTDRIFVFCMSSQYSAQLNHKFRAYGCVEIADVEAFKERLRLKIKTHLGINDLSKDIFLSGPISYYDSADEPGTRHACPDQIVMAKPKAFSDEQEYRFVFTEDAALFQVNQVKYSLSSGTLQSQDKHSHLILRLGSLADICRIVTP